MDLGPCQTSRGVPERGRRKVERGGGAARRGAYRPPAPPRDRSEVNLDLSLWFILELFVSFSRGTSAARSVGTGRIQQPVCVHVYAESGGGLFKKPLAQPDKCVQFGGNCYEITLGDSRSIRDDLSLNRCLL